MQCSDHSAGPAVRSQAGFTLVEIVLTIMIVGVLAGLAAVVMLQGVRAYTDEQSRTEVNYQARIAFERMAREIRLIRGQGADITTMTATDLRFIDVNGASVGFTWAAPVLSRWNGATSDVLASGVTSFAFNYYQQDGTTAAIAANVWFIEIVMTAQEGASTMQMRTRVHPRRF